RLGPTLVAPRDDHTKSGDALLAPTASADDLAALVAGAFALAPGARSLTLAGVRDGSRTLAALATARLPGPVVRDTDERGSYAPIAGSSLAALRATLSDNFRRNVRKAGNRLAKEPGVAIRLDRGPDASPATLDRFLALEAAGWKGRAGTAISLDPRLTAFYRELVAGFAARGRLEWHTLEIAGAPAAMHLGVRTAGALVLLKIAYDERHARLGPGNLLFERVLEREFEAGTAVEVNCTTDMAWHRNWALPRSDYARLVCFPAGPASGSLAFLPAALKARAKRVAWLRRTFSRDARPGPEQDA
ncbi:MAG: GNAT family N-acetyltransferase, partial [Planctomycetia bacterium]|nr:GNAT family N-acetyltransferase [Planctomycetia bacterium]